MKIARTVFAYLLAVAVTYVFAVAFYTQQVIAKQQAIGMVYSTSQQIDTFSQNIMGLWIYGAIIAIALLIAFTVAYFAKRVLKPLAPAAYPVAGAAAMLVMLVLIENQLGGGAGIMNGASGPAGLSLQALAGLLGGAAFAFKRPR